jgi:hypothetical protein
MVGQVFSFVISKSGAQRMPRARKGALGKDGTSFPSLST